MKIPASFKNPTCSEVQIDGYSLHWHANKQKTITLKRDFLKKLATVENNSNALKGFFEQYGPLWEGKQIHTGKARSMIRVFQLMYLLVLGIKEIGQPKAAGELDDKFFKPLKNWREKREATPISKYVILTADSDEFTPQATKEVYMLALNAFLEQKLPDEKSFKLRLMVSDNGETQFLPYKPSVKLWPLFSVPPVFTNWEEKKEWLYKELIKNTVNMLRDNIAFHIVQKNGVVSIATHPANAFAWAIYTLTMEKVTRCVCGAFTGGRKYCSLKCEREALSTSVKQSFLDYVNKQAKRDRLTQEEQEYMKYAAGKLFRVGDSKASLLKKVLRSITKEWPDRDYSFLKGFGSRKQKIKEG